MIDAIILFFAVYFYFLDYRYWGSLGLSIPNLDGNIIKQVVMVLAVIFSMGGLLWLEQKDINKAPMLDTATL